MTDKPSIISVLEDAQLAHRAGDFASALKFYEHFFDHALDDDPYALYGVRLAHCLQGWVKLAEEFPGAKNSLQRKQREMLGQFEATNNPERFHDYLTISRLLGTEANALAEFLKIHSSEPEKAATLVKYLWDDLILAEQWSVCNELLSQPNQKLDELFSIFDEAAQLKELDHSFNNQKFEQHIASTLLNDLQNLVLVLRHGNRGNDIAALERQFYQALQSRNHATLNKEVNAKGAFLFASH